MDDSSEKTSTNSITKISNLKICEVLKYKVFFSFINDWPSQNILDAPPYFIDPTLIL